MSFEFEKELAAFTQVMRDKLNQNQHKGTWKNETYEWLLKRLKEELDELEEAVEQYPDIISPYHPAQCIARECADIACFAMMIADIFKGLKEYPRLDLTFKK